MSPFSVRPLFDAESSTWTYILADLQTGSAAIIDPVMEQAARDFKMLQEMGVTLDWILETHVHADHITGASQLKDLTGAKIAYGAANKVAGADRLLQDGEEITVGASLIKTIFTPGHTAGCVSYLAGNAVFTGDALFIRGCGRTDFQNGSAAVLFDSVREKLFALPDSTVVYPGHDYKGMLCSTIGEEKQHNPRLKLENDKTRFVEIMASLKLSDPQKMDIAVPANLKAGRI